MEVHQLRYFVSVVEEGSFTAAARREQVSQSGISAQIAKLERELGHCLIERRPRSLQLTTTGATLLPVVRSALSAMGDIRFVADELHGLIRGQVRVGMVRGCDLAQFLDVVTTFRSQHPQVLLSLTEDDSDHLQDRVAAGELDLALAAYSGDLPEGLTATVLIEEPIVVAVPGAHEWAGRGSIALSDLVGEPLLCFPEGTGVRTALNRSAARAGAELTVPMEAGTAATVISLARRGAGIAILSSSMTGAIAVADDLVVLEIRDAAVRSILGLVHRIGQASPATRALLGDLTTALT